MGIVGKLDEKTGTDHVEHVNSQQNSLDDLDTIEETKTGKFAWLVSITAAIGGMLFGYDTGIISAVLVYIGTSLDHKILTSGEKELITSITSGAAFFGAIFAGLTADKYGRKPAIYVGCVLFIIGAILQAASFGLAQMTVGRLVVGFGVGSAAMIGTSSPICLRLYHLIRTVPMYIAEVSPAKYRGRMIGLDNMSITGGQLISYGIGAAFASTRGGWRYMVGGGAIPAIVLCALLPFCPESPRQLIYHGKEDQAKDVIRKIYPNATEEQVNQKCEHIKIHIEISRDMTAGKSQWWVFKQLYVVPANFRALVSACGLMAISQLGGFNSLMYYSSTLFALVGFSNPVAVGTVIAGTNFFFTWVNLMLVDRVGRRRILLLTMPFMGLALILAAIAFHWIPVNHDLTLKAGVSVGVPAKLVLVCMVVYVGFYSSGMGNTAWLSSEFFPMEIRAMGTMMLTMTCWGSNVIVASTFLTQMENTTPSGAFGFYAAICILGCFPCVYFCYPEVKGMTLEDIREIFSHGFGVQKARELQKAQKHNLSYGTEADELA
ncbi:general substrate transporter [Aureobasidium sp. EXF-10727]|nr:general substrate transporter [Aureobasidium sp. EXF-10727]KAI4726688.1 general substrate transporter [Aureobasidium sp. EXF-10728]